MHIFFSSFLCIFFLNISFVFADSLSESLDLSYHVGPYQKYYPPEPLLTNSVLRGALRRHRNVKHLDLSHNGTFPASLKYLPRFTKLETLELVHSLIAEHELAYIDELPKLRTLSLSFHRWPSCEVALPHLLSLEKLCIHNSFTYPDGKYGIHTTNLSITGCINVKSLELQESYDYDGPIKIKLDTVGKTLKQLEHLCIRDYCIDLADLQDFKKLKSLKLENCHIKIPKKVEDKVFLISLKQLSVKECNFTEDELKYLIRQCQCSSKNAPIFSKTGHSI